MRPLGRRLVLTTPNVACAKNVLKIVQGKNVNDRYSTHGIYGRHNREYTLSEVQAVLDLAGFAATAMFTAHVLFRRTSQLIAHFAVEVMFPLHRDRAPVPWGNMRSRWP